MPVLLLLMAGLSLTGPVDLIDRGLDWHSPNKETKIVFRDKKIIVSSQKTSNGIYNNRPLGIDTGKYKLLTFKLTSSKSGIGEIFWAEKNKAFSPLKNFPFYVGRSGTYYLNVAAYDRDHSTINQLLLFPFSGPGTAEISEFKFVRGGPGEIMLAAWQEFFGPLGRQPDGFYFLVNRSPRLFGRPFLLYINIFLGAALLVALVFRRKRWFLLLFAGCWILVELSSLLNNWIAFKNDWRFFGKNLEEQHTIINTRDFYPFLGFADQYLPAAASFEVRADGMDNDSRAQYYLYPRMV